MNEKGYCAGDGAAGADLVLCSERESPAVLRRIGQLFPRRTVVHPKPSPVKNGTEIRWNYELEVYECTACHAIMEYQFDFKVCPYCARPVMHTDSRRFGRPE